MVECRNLIDQFFKAFSIANFNHKKVSIIGFSSLWRRFSTHDNFVNRKSILLVTRVHHDPLKAAFHRFQNCPIRKALNPKSSLSILISKAQEPISKNQVLSLEIEKIFGNFFGLLPRDWTKIGGRFLTDHFNEKTDHFIWSMVFYTKIACSETY